MGFITKLTFLLEEKSNKGKYCSGCTGINRSALRVSPANDSQLAIQDGMPLVNLNRSVKYIAGADSVCFTFGGHGSQSEGSALAEPGKGSRNTFNQNAPYNLRVEKRAFVAQRLAARLPLALELRVTMLESRDAMLAEELCGRRFEMSAMRPSRTEQCKCLSAQISPSCLALRSADCLRKAVPSQVYRVQLACRSCFIPAFGNISATGIYCSPRWAERANHTCELLVASYVAMSNRDRTKARSER